LGFEGDGLQAVRKCRNINAALAAEGLRPDLIRTSLKYSQSGYSFGVLYTFTGGSDGAFPYNGVVIGSDGILYGSTYFARWQCGCGGNGCGTVFSLRPPATFCRAVLCPWMETVLYDFMGGSDGSEPTQGTNVIFDQYGQYLWYDRKRWRLWTGYGL
jgi:hypothetical protein